MRNDELEPNDVEADVHASCRPQSTVKDTVNARVVVCFVDAYVLDRSAYYCLSRMPIALKRLERITHQS